MTVPIDSSGIDARAFVQARMSSSRFPGKVLAPLAGKPLIAHVLERLEQAVGRERIVLLTSVEPADDPLALFAEFSGFTVFRGDPDDVVGRFQACLAVHSCEAFFRVCADSPLLEPSLFGRLGAAAAAESADLVTNTFPRTFPSGLSLELLRAAPFAALDPAALTADQREHVTQVYYDQPERYRIVNVEADEPAVEGETVAVDTIDDLRRLEALLAAERAGR